MDGDWRGGRRWGGGGEEEEEDKREVEVSEAWIRRGEDESVCPEARKEEEEEEELGWRS